MAACNNTFGSYVCLCLDGYEGDGKNCSGNFTILLLIAPLGSVTSVFFSFSFLHDLYTVKEAVVVTAITRIPLDAKNSCHFFISKEKGSLGALRKNRSQNL